MIRARFLAGLAVGLCLLVVGCGQLPSPTSPAPAAGSVAVSPVEAGASPPAAPQSGQAAPSTPPDWPTYHGDGARTGVAGGFPTLRGSLVTAWTASLDGAVYGEPLGVVGRVVVATEGDSVYALDPANGHVVWRRHLGTPVPLSSLPCGNIDPLGITSTPVYDRTSGSLFVVAEISGPRHVLFALDASTGVVRWSRSVDLAGDNPLAHQQRAALALGNGYVYVGFGGLAGDCGAYRGKVVGVPVTGHGATIAYRVPVAREGAVWATGGPVLDANGNLYVSIGNGSSTTTYDGSDSIVELSATLRLRSRFAPSQWARDNANDAALGSVSPVLVPGGWSSSRATAASATSCAREPSAAWAARSRRAPCAPPSGARPRPVPRSTCRARTGSAWSRLGRAARFASAGRRRPGRTARPGDWPESA